LETHGHARAIEQDGGLVAFAQETRGDQGIDEADGAFVGDAVEGDQGFLAGIGLHIFEDFLFIVHEHVAVFVGGVSYFWHGGGGVWGSGVCVRSAVACALVLHSAPAMPAAVPRRR